MDVMSKSWTTMSKINRQKIRKEMLVQAEKLLAGPHQSKAQLRAAARTMVDKALAHERRA
jgi:hypothetical protein